MWCETSVSLGHLVVRDVPTVQVVGTIQQHVAETAHVSTGVEFPAAQASLSRRVWAEVQVITRILEQCVYSAWAAPVGKREVEGTPCHLSLTSFGSVASEGGSPVLSPPSVLIFADDFIVGAPVDWMILDGALGTLGVRDWSRRV